MSILTFFQRSKPRTGLQIERGFRCQVCNRVDFYVDPFAEPVHCGSPMLPDDEVRWIGSGDPKTALIDSIGCDPPVNDPYGPFKVLHWKSSLPSMLSDFDARSVEAVWCLRPGRAKGERIGWLVKSQLVGAGGAKSVRWFMVPGVSPSEGVSPSRPEAFGAMLEAIERG